MAFNLPPHLLPPLKSSATWQLVSLAARSWNSIASLDVRFAVADHVDVNSESLNGADRLKLIVTHPPLRNPEVFDLLMH